MAKKRFVRFCYLSNESHGRERYPHMLRDESAVVELMPALGFLGFEYGGIFINWPICLPDGTPIEDTSVSDFDAINLGESDLLLLTTRPPINDKPLSRKPLRKSGSALERQLFDALKKQYFEHCSRDEISLHESIGQTLKDEYQNRSTIGYEVKGQHAGYMDVSGGERKQKYEPWTQDMTSGFIIHDRLGNKRRPFLVIFGMSGTMTLLLAHYLGKNPDILDQALLKPSFTMIEVVRTGPILCEKDPMRPFNLDFCLKWNWNLIGQCELE